MAERVQELVQKFNDVSAGFTSYVEGLTEAQWHALVANEKRTVGVVVHHVAASHLGTAGATTMLANGQDLTFTQEMIDQGAIKHAQEHANVTKAEAIALLQQNQAASAGMISGLTDEQLDNSGAVALLGGQKVPAHQFAAMVWIGHIQDHLNNIKAALGH